MSGEMEIQAALSEWEKSLHAVYNSVAKRPLHPEVKTWVKDVYNRGLKEYRLNLTRGSLGPLYALTWLISTYGQLRTIEELTSGHAGRVALRGLVEVD